MASLFNLIEDPCKSKWNSSVKENLFSSTILAMFFFFFFAFLFWIIYCLCLFFIELDYYFTMSKDKVKILGSPATWVEDFPINHGK